MDLLNFVEYAIKASQWIFGEFNNRNNAAQIQYQRLKQAEEEKNKGFGCYLKGEWQDAIYHFEAAQRFNPNISGVDYSLSVARVKLKKKKRAILIAKIVVIASLVMVVLYILFW